jgi:hypothetical protein
MAQGIKNGLVSPLRSRPPNPAQFLDFCSYCLCGSDTNHEPWCRGPAPNAVDVCSYCNTHVFARALDATGFGRLLAAEEQGLKDKKTNRQQAMDTAKREWAERRQRKVALFIAGIVISLVILFSSRECLFVLLDASVFSSQHPPIPLPPRGRDWSCEVYYYRFIGLPLC